MRHATKYAGPILCAMIPLTGCLSGCAAVSASNDTMASETTSSLKQKIVIGRTTKADVAGMFGAPSSKWADMHGESWGYFSLAGSTLRGLGIGNSAGLTVSFDSKGVVRNYTAS